MHLQASDQGEDDVFRYGVCAMQGWRTEMVRTCCLAPFMLPTRTGTVQPLWHSSMHALYGEVADRESDPSWNVIVLRRRLSWVRAGRRAQRGAQP